jgi:hypothetical protein
MSLMVPKWRGGEMTSNVVFPDVDPKAELLQRQAELSLSSRDVTPPRLFSRLRVPSLFKSVALPHRPLEPKCPFQEHLLHH